MEQERPTATRAATGRFTVVRIDRAGRAVRRRQRRCRDVPPAKTLNGRDWDCRGGTVDRADGGKGLAANQVVGFEVVVKESV